MAGVRLLPLNFRVSKDDGTFAFTDGTIYFYVGGTGNSSKTSITVYSDKDLSVSIGSSMALDSSGYPDTSENIWGSDQLSYDVGVIATGFNGGIEKIFPYVAVAVSAQSADATTTSTFKNLLTNGALYDWPGLTTYSNISGSGAAVEVTDGWFFAQASTAANAVSRQTADAADGKYALRFGRPNLSTNTNKMRVFQALLVEDAYKCSGQDVTFSFTLKKGTNFSGTSVAILIATGTTENEDPVLIDSAGWGGQVNVLSVTQAPTTAAVRYEFSAAIASNVKEIGVQLAYTPSGTAGADDWVQIENLQFEIADEATSFEYIPLSTDHERRNATAFSRKLIDLSSANFLKGLLFGGEYSNNGSDATNDIDISSGFCVDGSGASFSALAAMTKQLDANWAAGTNAGLRYSGAAIANGTYGLYAGWKADGTQDYYAYPWSAAVTDATVLAAWQAETGGADYAFVRRIGFILRESAAIVGITQRGDEFLRKIPISDIATSNPGTSAVLATMSVPAGANVDALISSRIANTTPVAAYGLLTSPDQTDTAASIQLGNFGATTDARVGGSHRIRTNTSRQIRYRVAASDAGFTVYLSIYGWVDTRGRLA